MKKLITMLILFFCSCAPTEKTCKCDDCTKKDCSDCKCA